MGKVIGVVLLVCFLAALVAAVVPEDPVMLERIRQENFLNKPANRALVCAGILRGPEFYVCP